MKKKIKDIVSKIDDGILLSDEEAKELRTEMEARKKLGRDMIWRMK